MLGHRVCLDVGRRVSRAGFIRCLGRGLGGSPSSRQLLPSVGLDT